MIALLDYPPMSASDRLTRLMIDRINRERINGTERPCIPRSHQVVKVDLPSYIQPPAFAYPNPPETHRETFGLFGEYIDTKD
jgi:hypothetical protein